MASKIISNEWNHVKVFFNDLHLSDGEEFTLNIVEEKKSFQQAQKIGFRGSSKKTLIDNVKIIDQNNNIVLG